MVSGLLTISWYFRFYLCKKNDLWHWVMTFLPDTDVLTLVLGGFTIRSCRIKWARVWIHCWLVKTCCVPAWSHSQETESAKPPWSRAHWSGVSRRAGAGFALGLGCVAALCRTALEAIVALQQQWEPEAKKDSTQQTPCWSRRENRCLTVYSMCFCKILCKLGFFPRWVFNTWNFKKLYIYWHW